MSEYIFYKLKTQAAQEINPQDVSYPVRTDHVNDIFGGQKVAVDLLLQDLDLFVHEHPELRPHYADTLGRLAYVVGVDADSNGDHTAALNHFELGLAAVPGNLTLRASYGLTLHKLGRENEALAQYEQIFADPDRPIMPWVWLLAVRVYAQRGQYARAHALLEECAPLFPEDESLQRFAQEMQSKAVAAATAVKPAPAPRTAAKAAPIPTASTAPTCPQCGDAVTPGVKFCKNCGAPMQPAPPAPPKPPAAAATCGRCGGALPPGIKFCGNCGAKVS
jgi:tetratricopeptide (TPR) repeat protein